jgi:hypothetical protein
MMRLLIAGDNPTAKALRGYLARHDFHLTNHAPDYTVRIDEDPSAVRPSLDGILSELEQAILRHLRKQTATPIEIHNASGVESDREVRIVAPAAEEERRAVEVAVFRALLEISGQKDAAGAREKRRWWSAVIPRKTK